jgi:hypothetical protein
MKQMNRAFKQLNEQIADKGKKEENLRLCSEFQRACAGAKAQMAPPVRAPRPPRGERPAGGGERPAGDRPAPNAEKPRNGVVNAEQPETAPRPPAAGQPGSGRPAAAPSTPVDPKRNAMYHEHLLKTLKQMIVVEEDLLADKFDAAKADLAKVGELGGAGHEALGVKDED